MRDRSSEELDAILQAFPDVFESQFGKPLVSGVVESILQEILQEKEKEVIRLRFLDFSPRNLREMLHKIKTKPQNIDTVITIDLVEPKKRGRPKNVPKTDQ